jgi:hypothetical protein
VSRRNEEPVATIHVVVVVLWVLAIHTPTRNAPVRAQSSGRTDGLAGGGDRTIVVVREAATTGVRVGGP